MTQSTALEQDTSLQIDPKEERKLLVKLDCWIGITIGILFLLSFLDRSNLGNAYSTKEFQEELQLPPNGINVVTSIFYAPYVLFELPSALIYKVSSYSYEHSLLNTKQWILALFFTFLQSENWR